MPDRIHLTVATVIEHNNKFLMVKETKFGEQVINQPAGHVEPGEDIQKAAVRETLEETGWDVRIRGFLGFSTHYASRNGVTYYRLSFVAEPLGFNENAQIDQDIDYSLWMSLEEIRASKHSLRSDMVLRCIEDYCAGHIYPLEIFRDGL